MAVIGRRSRTRCACCSAGGRGGCHRRPVRQRVRRAGPGIRGRRAAAEAAGTRRDLPGHLPAAGRRPPGRQRRVGPGRRRGVLRRRVGKQLDTDAVQDGFAAVSSPGRLERVRTSPTILVDAAHNPHGARALATALDEEFAFTRLVGVIAVMADKDVGGHSVSALVDVVRRGGGDGQLVAPVHAGGRADRACRGGLRPSRVHARAADGRGHRAGRRSGRGRHRPGRRDRRAAPAW